MNDDFKIYIEMYEKSKTRIGVPCPCNEFSIYCNVCKIEKYMTKYNKDFPYEPISCRKALGLLMDEYIKAKTLAEKLNE